MARVGKSGQGSGAGRRGRAAEADPAGPSRLQAGDVEQALEGRDKEPQDKTLIVPVRIAARYVANGTDRRGGGAYTLRYRWEGGGLFGGRSLRLVSLSR